MKVLLVTHGVKDPRTAVYRNTLGRAEFLRELGHDAHVLTPTDLGFRYGRLLPLWYPFAVGAFLLRNPPFDVVLFHSHTGWVYQMIRTLLPRHKATRVGVAFHGVDVMYVKALAEELTRGGSGLTFRFRLVHLHLLPALCAWSCRRADRVFCLNSEEERFLLTQRWTTRECLRLMPHCVRTADVAQRRRTSDNGIRILTVAQWLPIKGIRYLVDAFATVVRSGRNVTLVCAGTGKAAADVLPDFPEDVRDRVTVIPSFAQDEAARLFQEADVFALASVFEAFGMVILEAMAAGLPIVATAVGGPKDILATGEDALLVPPGDAQALSAALQQVIDDAGMRSRLGDRALRKVSAFLCDRVMPPFAAELLGTALAPEVTAG